MKTHSKLIAFGLICGALVIRLAFILQTKNLALYYHPFLDADFFRELANFKRNVAWLDATLPFREPLFVYVVAGFYSIFRESLMLVRIVQALLGAISVGLVYSIVRKAYGSIAGLMAGCLFALYVPAIFFAGEINEATITATLVIVSFYVLVRQSQAPSSRSCLGSGLLLGIASLGRLTAIGALAGWLGYLATSRENLRRNVILLLVGFIIPGIAYQTIVLRDHTFPLFPLRSGWQSFLAAGSDGAVIKHEAQSVRIATEDGVFPVIVSTDRIAGQQDATRLARAELGQEVTAGTANRHWWQRALGKLKQEPGGSIRGYLTRLGTLLGSSEPPSNFDMRFVARFSGLLRTRIFSFAVVAPLGLLGLILLRGWIRVTIALSVAGIALLTSLFPITDIDKFLLACMLMIPAGGGLAAILDSILKRNLVRAVRFVVTAVVLGIVVMLLPGGDLDEADQLCLLGNVYAGASLYDRAEETYKQAIAADPDKPDAYTSLARLYGNTGKSQEAIGVLEKALSRGLDDPRLRIEKASLLVLMGRAQEAKQIVSALQTQYPLQPRVHELMGLCLMSENNPQGAIEELTKEIDYGGGGFVTFTALGQAYFATGNYSEAADYLEKALALNPLSTAVTSIAIQLADAYTKLGYHYKACDVLSRIARIDPGNIPVRFKLANCLYRAGRLEDAIKEFKQLHKFDPANADILVNLGTVYANMDSLDTAIELWRQALEIDPNNEMAKENLRQARQ